MEGAVTPGRPAERAPREDPGPGKSVGLWSLRAVVLLVLVGAGVFAQAHFDLGSRSTSEGARAFVEAHAPYGPLIFIGIFIAGIFLRVPAIVLVMLGGILFERLPAFAFSWIAAIVGSGSTFLLIRYFAREAVQRSLISRFARLRTLDERLARHGFVTVLVLRAVLFLAPPLNWALGATRVRFPHYVAGTAVGVIPGIAAIVLFADSIADVGSNNSLLSIPALAGAVLVVALLIVATIAGRRLFGEPARTPSP